MITRRVLTAGVAGLVAGCAGDKQPVRILVGSAAGSAGDQVARLTGKHLTRLFGNKVEVENESRANGKLAAQRLARAEPDGNLLAFLSTGLLYGSLLREQGITWDIRQFGWLGSLNTDHRVLIVTQASGVQRFEDLLTRKKPLILICGATSAAGYYEARILRYLTGANIKIVPGFRGGQRNLALMSGEAEAVIASADALEPALDMAGTKVVLRMNDMPLPLPPEKGGSAPSLASVARGPDAKPLVDLIAAHARLGRIAALPPGASPQILSQWRDRFAKLAADEAFRQEAAGMGYRIEGSSGEAVSQAFATLLADQGDVRAALTRAIHCEGAITCV